MKKNHLYVFALIAAMFCLAACDDNSEGMATAVSGVTMEPVSSTLAVGGELTLRANVLPENATNKEVTWSSGNPRVAKVEGGIVTAIAVGETVITVTTDDGGKTAICEITVIENDIPVSGITLDRETLEIEIGDTEILIAIVEPDDATDREVVWSSSSDGVAEVDQDGKVTAIAKGQATITAMAGGIAAKCEVTVVPAVSEITLDYETLTIEVGFTRSLTATVKPDDATAEVVWTSSRESTATVDQNGTVSGIDAGTATITATAGGKSAKCEVVITPAKWARSNIVWIEDSTEPDGGRLSFAVTVNDNTAIPANSQGVYFRWGSLVAVSPVGNYGAGSILHSPSGDKTYEWWTSGGQGWGELPYINDTGSPFNDYVNAADDFATYNGGTGFDTAIDKGDICRYISSRGWVDGNWRLPTAYELGVLTTEGAVMAAGSPWNGITVPDEGDNANGLYRFESGYFLGYGVDTNDNTENPAPGTIFAPAAGTMHISSGALYNVGVYGYLWTGSSAQSQFAAQLAFYGDRAGWPEQNRRYAATVRCIRILQ